MRPSFSCLSKSNLIRFHCHLVYWVWAMRYPTSSILGLPYGLRCLILDSESYSQVCLMFRTFAWVAWVWVDYVQATTACSVIIFSPWSNWPSTWLHYHYLRVPHQPKRSPLCQLGFEFICLVTIYTTFLSHFEHNMLIIMW